MLKIDNNIPVCAPIDSSQNRQSDVTQQKVLMAVVTEDMQSLLDLDNAFDSVDIYSGSPNPSVGVWGRKWS